MKLEDIPAGELMWAERIPGLLLLSAENDSDGKPIEPHEFYRVAKHESGKIIIVRAGINMVTQFMDDNFPIKSQTSAETK